MQGRARRPGGEMTGFTPASDQSRDMARATRSGRSLPRLAMRRTRLHGSGIARLQAKGARSASQGKRQWEKRNRVESEGGMHGPDSARRRRMGCAGRGWSQ